MFCEKKAFHDLTGRGKACYNIRMETIQETTAINERIAKNLAYYRKALGLTQAELAQKINYSDKSVSKWESANGVPDVYILLKLASLYGVTVSDLVEGDGGKPLPKKSSRLNSSLIMLLASGLVWLVAIIFYAVMTLFLPEKSWWLAFLYAVPICSIVVLVLAAVFHRKKTHFIATATLIWTAITAIYVSFKTIAPHAEFTKGVWVIYLIGAALQVLQIVWSCFRVSRRKTK